MINIFCIQRKSTVFRLSLRCKQNSTTVIKVKISQIIHILQAEVVTIESYVDKEITKAFSSDLMSDVLTLDEDSILLISGLANIQLIRTAEMADIHVVVLARGKKASSDMVELANESGIVIIETPRSIFGASGILYSHGLKPVY